MTSTTQARTQRVRPEKFVGTGAVDQHEGNLLLYRCNECGGDVVWCKSKRTGRAYLVNVSRGHMGQLFYMGHNVHPRNCLEVHQQKLSTYTAQRVNQERGKKVVALLEEQRELLEKCKAAGWSNKQLTEITFIYDKKLKALEVDG